jgi:tetratricopeptide (TPR) repeat protein
MNDKIMVERTIQLAEALETYRKVIEKDSKNFDAFFSIAEIFYKLSRFEEALYYTDKALDNAAKKSDEYRNTLILKGSILRDLEKYDDASKIFKEVLDADTKNMNALFNIGLLEARQGNYEKAIDYLDSFLKGNPENPEALAQRGLVLLQMGQYEDANKHFDKAYKIDPKSPGAVWGKGYLVGSQLSSKALTNIRTIQEKLIERHGTIVEKTQNNLTDLQKSFSRGFQIVMGMFICSFVIGIALLIGAVLISMQNKESLTSYIMGAAGAGSLVISLITLSPERLQKNRVDFSQWMMSYFTWANAFFAINAYFTQEIQEKKRVEWKTVQEIQNYLSELTNETVMIIDECCEFKPESPLKASILTGLFKKEKGAKEEEKTATS